MSIAKILISQVVFMGHMLKALVIPIDGIRINLKYCSNQLVYGLYPGGGGYIVYYTRYPGVVSWFWGVSQVIKLLRFPG